jgi:tetratricopeptide (TPR) repeat protein
MARTLSRIACDGGFLIVAIAVLLTSKRAPAEDYVRVSPSGADVENPFAARTQSRQKEQRPVTVPPDQTGVPESYQNPFAHESAQSPRATLRLHPGSLSRWNRAGEKPAASAERRSLDAVLRDAPPAADRWDLLAPLAVNEERAALFSLPEDGGRFGGPTPPDPSRFGTGSIQQPAWLVPNDSDSQGKVSEAAHVVEQRQAPERMPAPPPAVDPFDREPASAEVVVSDASAGQTTPRPLPPTSPPGSATAISSGRDANQWYTQAEQAAAKAESVTDLAAVVRLCQQGMASQPESEMALSLRSLAAWACNRAGELESDDRREDEALKAFELAIQWDPGCWLALHNRAVSRAQQGDAAGALGDFNRTLDLNPGLAVAYRNRGELLAALGRTDEAVADYDRVIAQLPDEADLYTMRGHALHRLGQYKGALADLDRSIELDPRQAEAHAHRGNVYAELGEFERAIVDFRQAIALDPKSADAYRSLAWLLATCPESKFRAPDQALASAQRAAELSAPGDPFVLDALAAAHANAGQFERAVRYQQEAMSNAPQTFAQPFAARLALYEQRRPFRNDASTSSGEEVRAASLDAPNQPPSRRQ